MSFCQASTTPFGRDRLQRRAGASRTPSPTSRSPTRGSRKSDPRSRPARRWCSLPIAEPEGPSRDPRGMADLSSRHDGSLRSYLTERPVPWGGSRMSAQSLATARLMETWAHGLDCFAALNATPRDTERLRHVAWLGFAPCPTPSRLLTKSHQRHSTNCASCSQARPEQSGISEQTKRPRSSEVPRATGVASPPTDYAHPHNRRSVAKAHWHGPLSRWFEPSCRRLTLRPGQKSYRLIA